MAGYTINDKQDLRDRIDEALDTFPRLKERLTQYAGTMSGGEQQQLIFARAIILKPRVILIDEPSLGLAPAIVEQAFKHIENIAAKGVSILLVEQNARRGLASSNFGTVMDFGEIVFEKPASQVLSDDRIQELFREEEKIMFIIQTIILGLCLGFVYALMATGLTLIFGVMRIVNLATSNFYISWCICCILLIRDIWYGSNICNTIVCSDNRNFGCYNIQTRI